MRRSAAVLLGLSGAMAAGAGCGATGAPPPQAAYARVREQGPRPAPSGRDTAEAGDAEVEIPAGAFIRGHAGGDRVDEGPAHRVRLSAFRIDATLVTRAAFTRFVERTGHVTSAERLGYGVASREGMDDWAWERVPHASWRRPFHETWPDTAGFLHPEAPAVMVSHADALAYCRYRGKRLPTEAEWEYAMRAGSERTRFPWGETPERASPDGGAPLGLNFWQGASHHHNDREDGFLYVSPVRAFPPNAWGVFDPVGNVWQWTADWYAPDTYAKLARAGSDAVDPTGPSAGKNKGFRGGSWWCGVCTCEGYGLFYRGKASPEAPFNNNGFRCARSR